MVIPVNESSFGRAGGRLRRYFALSSVASNTGPRSPGGELMTCNTMFGEPVGGRSIDAAGNRRKGEERMESVITTPADAAAEPAGTSKYGWRVVLFSGAGWFFDGYVINVWPLAIPFVMTDLHLTVKDIGTITTLYVTAYMLGALLGGTFADYLGRRSVLSFSVLFYMFVDALTALARGFWSLGFFRFMTGTGTGMELPVGSTFITEAVHNRWRTSLTASVIRNSRRLPDRRIAARTSRQGLGERDDEAPSDCCDRVGDVPFGSDRRRLWVVTVGNGRSRERRGEMWSRGGDGASFGDQKAVGGNTEGGMVVEAAPPAPFIITKPELLLQLLIIALDPPSQLCDINQTFEGDILWQSGKPILGRLGFFWRPLDQQPLFGARLGQQGIAMCRPHPLPRKARREPVCSALAPRDCLPRFGRQAESEHLRRDRLMLQVASKQLRWSSDTLAKLRCQRPSARGPDRGIGTDPGHIAQAERGNLRSQPRVVAVTGIHQHHTLRQSGGSGRFDLLKSDLGLGLESDRFRDLRLVPARLVLRPILREIEPISEGRLASWLASDSVTATPAFAR